MATSISGSIYFSGLDGTGNDWAQTLEQLKQIESMNLTRLEAWKSDWNIRYQGFTKIIEAVTTARTELSSLKNRNSFVSKMVSSSKEEFVTGTATADAIDAQHRINVKQVANNAVWANTGHLFKNKTDIINTTDKDIEFKYNYAGKDYSITVPPNTTLDSFINLVNNNKENPGIKASLIQTSGGYYFQIAGKDTGEANSLTIESCELLGFDDSGIKSIWESNDAIKGDATFTDPSSIAYDFVLRDGKTVTITMDGDSTLQDFVDQVNARIGKDTASIDPNTGEVKFKNVQAVVRRDADNTNKDTQYQAGYVRVDAGDYNDINDKYMIAENDKSTISFEIKMKDGSAAPQPAWNDDDGDGVWTFVYENLPAADENDEDYVYWAEEQVGSVDGWYPTYGTADAAGTEVDGDQQTGTQITNHPTLLNLAKVSDFAGDKVTLQMSPYDLGPVDRRQDDLRRLDQRR